MEWQPIDTAPKDETEFLGWDGERMYVATYREDIWFSRSGFVVTLSFADESDEWEPTHWMPLPTAPAALDAA